MRNFRFAYDYITQVHLRQQMRTSVQSCLFVLVGTLMMCFPATSAFAQAPGWSRGQQNLAITYDECVRRMPAALQAEGYQRDDNPGGNFAVGIKEVHTAVIICSPAPEAKILVQIVVASNGGGGGTERQRLQARMEEPGTVGSGGLRILSAVYGAQGKFADVSQRLQSQIRGEALSITVSNDSMGGDPIYGVLKSLHIKYEYRGRVFEENIQEGSSLSIPKAQMEEPGTVGGGGLRILSAVYGAQGKFADVSQRLQSQIRGEALSITVGNDSMGGDPAYGVLKSLHIKYEYRGRVFEENIQEGSSLSIPK